MKDEQREFMSLVSRPPARLTVEQVAWMLNCAAHDIPVLVTGRLLKPLGNPPPNGVKYFATNEIMELVGDRAWLNRATHAIQQHWQGKNLQRKLILSEDAIPHVPRRPVIRPLAQKANAA